MSHGERNTAEKVVPIRPSSEPSSEPRPPHTRSARVVGRSPRGLPLVLLPGEEEPREALPLSEIPREALEGAVLRGARCLLTFTADEPEQPYLLGIVAPVPAEAAIEAVLPEMKATIERDGERLVVEAERELVLRCGEAEVVLREDGKIRISGVDVISKARRQQRIKGGSVSIN